MRLLISLLICYASSACYAVSFLAFDPNSMATGGAGSVGGGNGAQPFLSPATFAIHDGCCLARIHSGARIIDRQYFLATADEMRKSKTGERLDRQIKDARDTFEAGNLRPEPLRNLGASADLLIAELNKLPNKPLRVSASAGAYVLAQNEALAVGMFKRSYLVLGAIIANDPKDLRSITQLQSTVYGMANVIEGANAIEALSRTVNWERIEHLAQISITSGTVAQQLYEYQYIPGVPHIIAEIREFERDLKRLDEHIDLRGLLTALAEQNEDFDSDDIHFDNIDLRRYLRYPIPETLNSRIQYSGAEVEEAGFNISFSAPSVPALTVGANIKEIAFSTIAFNQRIDQFNLDHYQSSSTRKDYRFWNVDLGLRYKLTQHWTVGAVIKNLHRKQLTTILGDPIRVDPIARIGVVYQHSALLLAVDTDLTKNEPLGFDPHKQYVAIGAQIRYWRQNVLRLGYRYNFVDHTGLPALGLGFQFYNASIDVAGTYAPSDDEAGLSIQIGLML